jgi:hypothetical protein
MEKEVKPTEQKAEVTPAEAPADNKNSEVVTESKHSSNKVLVIVLVVIGAFVVLGAAGTLLAGKIFKKAATTIVENSTGTKVTTDSKSTTVTTKDGSVTASTEQKLPADFPTGIPLYSAQKITSSYKSKNSNGNYWQVMAEVSATAAKAKDTLKSQYSSWELSSEVENDGTYMLTYKNSLYSVDVIIATENNQTTVTYDVSDLPKTE